MNIKNGILSIGLAIALTVPSFAASGLDTKPSKTVTKQIEKIIKKMDLKEADVKDLTLKLKFTVNDNNELIVLSTGDSKIDTRIKGALNYKSIEGGLEQYKVYILPIRFEPNS